MLLVYRPFVQALSQMPMDLAQAARRFALKFLREPHLPGFRLKRLNHSELWSARVNRDIRAILAQWAGHWIILHVNHHDLAYEWAQTCRLTRHEVTGEAQVIRAQEFVSLPDRAYPGPLAGVSDITLLEAGVPEDWLDLVRRTASTTDLLQFVDYLPEEVVERLLELAQGRPLAAALPGLGSRTVAEVVDAAALKRLLAEPLEQWVVFLHPDQKAIVEGDFAGPVQVTGAAGTGKTVVAMHRAHFLVKHGRRVLLTSFVITLCENIQLGLKRLCTTRQLRKIRVQPVYAVAEELFSKISPGYRPCLEDDFERILARRAENDREILRGEWTHVVDRNGLTSVAEYCRAPRPGRAPLSTEQRQQLWKGLGSIRSDLEAHQLITYPEMCRRLSSYLRNGRLQSPFDAVVVDELQDLEPSAITLLRDLAGEGANRLMLIGDAGQRIYRGRFSLRGLGIDTVGRKLRLRVNYRTTEQIRRAADGLLDLTLPGFDGEAEPRHSVSLLVGPEPSCECFGSTQEQAAAVSSRVVAALQTGLKAHEIAIFCRSQRSFPALQNALGEAGLSTWNLKSPGPGEGVRLATMHRAKGLEFKQVFVVDCSADKFPHPKALDCADPADRAEALEREKQLLYVSLTRARDQVTVCYVGTPSPLLESVLKSAPSSRV